MRHGPVRKPQQLLRRPRLSRLLLSVQRVVLEASPLRPSEAVARGVNRHVSFSLSLFLSSLSLSLSLSLARSPVSVSSLSLYIYVCLRTD